MFDQINFRFDREINIRFDFLCQFSLSNFVFWANFRLVILDISSDMN